MAAGIIATCFGVPPLKVNLSQTVSRYMGETEKNMHSIIDEAESAGAVLLLDEAGALFGRRTEVRDAQDRYANVEIYCLLQRMERHAGLAILTTNLKQNLDRALQGEFAICPSI